MKVNLTQFGFALATLFLIPMANAGFTFENTAEPVVASASKSRQADGRIPVTTVGSRRNINPSASGERISKLNRQRIDLESRVTSRITQSGDSPTELQTLRGMGHQVTFEDSLRQVLPTGWTVYSDQEAPLETLLDWQGARTWPMVMHSMLTTLDMRAHIDWDAHELMLFVPAQKPDKPAELLANVESVVVDSPSTHIKSDSSQSISAKKQGTLVNVNDIVWSVKAGSLRENLRILAAESGWTLVWNATIGDMTVNYDVEEPGYQFTGSVIGADGVIAKVIDLYAQAEHPLAVTFFHGNKVVEVTLHQIPDAKMNPSNVAKIAPQRAAVTVPDPVTQVMIGQQTKTEKNN